MIASVSPSVISGTVTAAASKSAMQRACALALLNNGITIIQNPGSSNDDLAAINIIKELGATVHYENGCLVVKSNGEINANGSIDCGESGLSLRMFAAIAALGKNEIVLNGNGSLLKRPIYFFDEIFPLLNISAKTKNGFLPVSLHGPLVPKDISIDGSVSSQYLTGLLFSFAKAAKEEVVITVNNLKSKPYIDLSISMLKYFGYEIKNDDYKHFSIPAANNITKQVTYNTEADWSGAAFLLVAGAITGDIRVKGLDTFSTQADRAILDVLIKAGANIKIEGTCILINNQHSLKAFYLMLLIARIFFLLWLHWQLIVLGHQRLRACQDLRVKKVTGAQL